VHVRRLFEPLLIFGDGEKVDPLFALCDLLTQVGKRASKEKSIATHSDDGCHKLNQEAGDLQQGREEMVQKVDEKALDVRTVVILQCARSVDVHQGEIGRLAH